MARPTATNLLLSPTLVGVTAGPMTETLANNIITQLFKSAYLVIYGGATAYSATPTDAIIDTEIVYGKVIGRATQICMQIQNAAAITEGMNQAITLQQQRYPYLDFSEAEKAELAALSSIYADGD